MPTTSSMGATIRRLRRERRLTQSALAGRAGISISYLNLIENNRRPLTDSVALALAEAMDLDPHELSGGEEALVLSGLIEAFDDPLFRDNPPSREDVLALAATPQNVTRAILRLHNAYRHAREEQRTLVERLAGESLMTAPAAELRGIVASIRSFGEILHDHADVTDQQRQHFLGLLVRDTEQLTELLDRLPGGTHDPEDQDDPGPLPSLGAPGAIEASEFLEGRNNYFAALEDAADEARAAVLGARADQPDTPLLEPLTDLLATRHGISVLIVAGQVAPGRLFQFHQPNRRLILSESLSRENRCFHIARQLGLAANGRILDRCLEQDRRPAPELTSICRDALADYFARAVIMPYAPFQRAAQDVRHDLERLASRFDADFESVCQRLTTLRRPGAAGIPFHLVRADIGGNVTHRFNGSGLRIARYGGVCPRWSLHEAFLTPGQIRIQYAQAPDASLWLNIARTVSEASPEPGVPANHAALTIGCNASYAARIAYFDDRNIESGAPTPIGVNCRLCSRNDCRQRAYRPLDIATREAPSAAP